jgi:hypothetical protein
VAIPDPSDSVYLRLAEDMATFKSDVLRCVLDGVSKAHNGWHRSRPRYYLGTQITFEVYDSLTTHFVRQNYTVPDPCVQPYLESPLDHPFGPHRIFVCKCKGEAYGSVLI